MQQFEGVIKNVSIGFYDLCIKDGEKTIYCIQVGVGDVFLVAGQPNAISPAQDHPPYYPKTALVSVNDIYRHPRLDFTQFTIPSEKNQ
jgi:hypothetical protein